MAKLNEDQANSEFSYFSETMLSWYRANGRRLPWRNAPTAYQVWVSELMLQQTQVATVIPYYERWLARFPTLVSLADAEIDEVLQLWSGLGYYRRARYLHEGARVICGRFGGEFPQKIEELRKIPGIGAYTAGAIASFAFHQDVPAIDGNAERVFSRFFGIVGDLTSGEGRKQIEFTAEKVASCGHCSEVNQAIMDLGSGACARAARCEDCPISPRCYALRNGLVGELPQKKKKVEKYDEFRAALKICGPNGCVLIARRRKDLLLGGLWEFPMIEIARTKGEVLREQSALKMRLSRENLWRLWLQAHFNGGDLSCYHVTKKQVSHTFTHIQMTVALDEAEAVGDLVFSGISDETYDAFEWVDLEKIREDHALSSLMARILA